ncbi:MAG TPA: hypothetical protein VF981_07390 [Gemmatimonadaceae bacterium]
MTQPRYRSPPRETTLTRVGLLLGVSLLRAVFWLLRRLPEDRALAFAHGVSRVLGVPLKAARRRTQQIVFTDGDTGFEALEQQHTAYLARLRLHIARLPVESPRTMGERVSFEGLEHLAAARDQHRGVLIVSGHVGTWLHVPTALAGRGFPMLFFVNPHLPGLAGMMDSMASRYGFSLAHVGADAHAAARDHFRSGGLLHVTIDATVHPERSVWLRFGQSELLVDPGPAVLALRHRVPVVRASAFHDAAGHSCVRLSPPMLVGPGTTWTRAEPLMQHWLDCLWSDVSAHPAQWWPIAYVQVRRPLAVVAKIAPPTVVSTR